MVDFVRLQEIVKDRLEQDRSIHCVEAVGPTLEAAVADAAALLDISVSHLEYEVIERGSDGFLGVGKKEWRINAYERVIAPRKKHRESLFSDDSEDLLPAVEDRDGEAFVQFRSGGDVLLKVTAPSGNGRKMSDEYAEMIISHRGNAETDKGLVSKTVSEALGAYIKVGAFKHNPLNDSMASVEIIEGEMKAYITVIPPGEGGCDISFDKYINLLKSNRVIHGIKEDFLRVFADQPVYKEQVVAAEGTKPADGRDAYIQYNFETDISRVRLKEGSGGRVNFKELNIIQNVVENQPLAKKIPPQKGVPGETVTGTTIPAKDGKDINLPIGTNVHLDTDEETILADINGQVVIANDLINVEPVYTVDGDVGVKTGNIIFLGNVIVNGNVDDGFSVKAEGNIEVTGTVAKAELDAEGDIIIYQGINGKGGGNIRAGKSLLARFIENANITVGDNVIASDGIINSKVDAFNRIICQGKRACIMGGRLRAGEEINAKVIGNPTSGTDTLCEVGFDPKGKEELTHLQQKRDETEKLLEDIKLNMQTLINIKKQRKSLPEDKEVYLQELMEKRAIMFEDLKKTEEGIKRIHDYLIGLKSRGRISASVKVYPGVKIVIRDVRDEVHSEYKAVTFVLENGLIRVSPYEELSDKTKKGLDGHTTN